MTSKQTQSKKKSANLKGVSLTVSQKMATLDMVVLRCFCFQTRKYVNYLPLKCARIKKNEIFIANFQTIKFVKRISDRTVCTAPFIHNIGTITEQLRSPTKGSLDCFCIEKPRKHICKRYSRSVIEHNTNTTTN